MNILQYIEKQMHETSISIPVRQKAFWKSKTRGEGTLHTAQTFPGHYCISNTQKTRTLKHTK